MCCCTSKELRTQGQTAMCPSILSKEAILQFEGLRINAENKSQNGTYCHDAPSYMIAPTLLWTQNDSSVTDYIVQQRRLVKLIKYRQRI